MAVLEQTVDQLGHKLDNMKIDAHRKACEALEVPVNKDISPRLEQQMHSSTTGDSLNSGGSISSSEAGDEYSELAFVATPNGFLSPDGTFYAGSPATMNMAGYVPYSIDGVQFHSPVMDYNYVNQPFCPSGMQYPVHGSNGYVYGPQVYQYIPQPYYQQALGGQYLAVPPGLPAGGLMLVDSQDPGCPGVVMSNGFANLNPYAGPIPGFPMSMLSPSVSCNKGAVPVPVTYPPSNTLRASAPAWVEPATKPKGSQKEGNVGIRPGASQIGAPNFVQSSKGTSLSPPAVNGTFPKSCSVPSKIGSATASHNSSGTSESDVTQSGTDMKANGCLDDDSKHERVVGGTVNGLSLSFDKHYELNKDTWVSKVRGQQSMPVVKSVKASSPIPNKGSGAFLPNGQEYNSTEFVTKYDDAKHFIIKSYSEENVHKSIQYGVWASTPNGNKKLDEAYQDAQCRAGGKPRGCPVFLFFSVNGSRQFCGVAEMIGPVDYTRTMEFWEQHKWSGSFPVKWHIIKDVPNSQLCRIILENNENKPVTNSRDTQEVNFQQGLEMLNIFKSYPVRSSILDELPMYSCPPKVVQDTKPPQWSPQCFPKIGEQIAKERDGADGTKSAKLNCTMSKTLDMGPKPKETNHQGKTVVKSMVGKVVETSVQDTRLDKEKIKLEKENIKIPSKEERVMAPA